MKRLICWITEHRWLTHGRWSDDGSEHLHDFDRCRRCGRERLL